MAVVSGPSSCRSGLASDALSALLGGGSATAGLVLRRDVRGQQCPGQQRAGSGCCGGRRCPPNIRAHVGSNHEGRHFLTSPPVHAGSMPSRSGMAINYKVGGGEPGGREDYEGFGASDRDRRSDAYPAIAALERSYITNAAIGQVECNSKGCRPILGVGSSSRSADDDDLSSDWSLWRGAGSPTGSRVADFHALSPRRDTKHQEIPANSSVEYAEFLDEVWSATEITSGHYEAAMLRQPRDARVLTAYARFAWTKLRDVPKAECLYKLALQESPDSAEALASYALFLWESEGCS